MIKSLMIQYWPIVKLIMIVAIGILAWLLLGDDNPIEQEAETVIKEETGLTVDISP